MSEPQDENVRVGDTESDRAPAGHAMIGHRPFLLSVVVFVLAAGIRTLSFRSVFRSGEIVFFDGDSYYHLWRIWNAASKSIPLAAKDPFVNFPHGGEIIWPPAFDWIIAEGVRHLALGPHAMETLCAWLPVAWGAAAAVVAARIALRSFSTTAGWVTGLLVAVLPGSFNYTQIGFFDHHAAIALIGTVLLGGAMRIVRKGDNGPRAWPVLAGASCAFALWIWTGALLMIAVLQIALILWALGAEQRAAALQRTLRLALAHLIIAVAILPISNRVWEHFGSFSPLAPTLFQPIFYGSGAICLASAALSWQIPRLGLTRFRRLVSSGSVGIVGACIAFATLPRLAPILTNAASWFSEDSPFLSVIHELQPLLGNGENFNWRQPTETLSLLVFGFPLALLAIVWRTTRPDRWLLLFWSAVFFALTMSQVRFINTFAIAFSIVWGGAISVAYHEFRKSRPGVRTQGFAVAIASMALLAAVVVPAGSYYERVLDSKETTARILRQDAYRTTARWLAASDPAPLDARGHPLWGLLCPWSFGHEFRYYSGWATVVDGFGPFVSPENTRLASRYFRSEDEHEAIEILDQMRVRYVATDIAQISLRPKTKRSMRNRLGLTNGSGREALVGEDRKRVWIPALTRHRLVFEAPHSGDGVWLYEIVKGATITGSAAPGSVIEIELNLLSSSGRVLRWISREIADASGDFRMRVPYSTLSDTMIPGASRIRPSRAITTMGAYELRTNRGRMKFDVSETSIRRGATIRPPLGDS